MNRLRKMLGILWMGVGLCLIIFLQRRAGAEVAAALKIGKQVIDTQIFWYTILPVFAPISAGLCLFGWYAFRGEYRLPESPDDSRNINQTDPHGAH